MTARPWIDLGGGLADRRRHRRDCRCCSFENDGENDAVEDCEQVELVEADLEGHGVDRIGRFELWQGKGCGFGWLVEGVVFG
ncbi:hypothetical protein M0R45_034884 [Rubus argutus]|uniref:Uncharacterized protein n=1 Tax=Rubus argutus TaxID=59490 RepID=A0AAW1VT21_RUBAR